MLIAEELECDWKKIRVESAPVAPVYNHTAFGIQMTGGSTSVWSEYDRLRKVGAAAREMLIAAAAATWKVGKTGCKAQNGAVVSSGGRKLTYGQLAEKASKLPVPKNIRLKEASSFKLIGKPTRRLDTPEKTNGTAVFGIDTMVPGMLMAVVARPPVFGGRVKGFNAAKAKAVKGVREVVQIDAGVAVIADTSGRRRRGVMPWRLPGTMGRMQASPQKGCMMNMQGLPDGVTRCRREGPAASPCTAPSEVLSLMSPRSL